MRVSVSTLGSRCRQEICNPHSDVVVPTIAAVGAVPVCPSPASVASVGVIVIVVSVGIVLVPVPVPVVVVVVLVFIVVVPVFIVVVIAALFLVLVVVVAFVVFSLVLRCRGSQEGHFRRWNPPFGQTIPQVLHVNQEFQIAPEP